MAEQAGYKYLKPKAGSNYRRQTTGTFLILACPLPETASCQ